MARIRTIKPEFFTSEDIVVLTPMARLLYIALWCEADREGRFAWKPRTFKMRYLPADNCDINVLSEELQSSGLVVLYGDGLAYIPSFSKHQHVNPREAVSNLPNPDDKCTRDDASVTREHASCTVTDAQVGREGKERNKEQGASPVGEALPDPDAGKPDKVRSISDAIPYQAIVDAYNRTMEKLPKVREVTATRKTSIRSAWQASADRRTLDFWIAYFEECADESFLNGTGPYTAPHENWRPDFDFLMKPKTITRTYERALDRMERSA